MKSSVQIDKEIILCQIQRGLISTKAAFAGHSHSEN